MTTIDDIEKAVAGLNAEELRRFREWFDQFDAASWDHQIELDAAAGRLDESADAALEDLRSGRCTGIVT
ncbi:MAG: hypothetical protein ABFD92_19960 [Planctomycetaceae bacterium]|nr:hypothetical protein [Planctomycetaceae bacterium]